MSCISQLILSVFIMKRLKVVLADLACSYANASDQSVKGFY